VAPGIVPFAGTLGSVDLVNCQPTVNLIEQTSPKEAGYCTSLARIIDNPGYNPDVMPAPPLKHVILAVGGSC
jgi:hypothetical protein